MTIYIAYNKRGCVTAKALTNKLNNLLDTEVRRINAGRGFKKIPTVLIRWGNSTTKCDVRLEVNKNCNNASNKCKMIQSLIANGIPTPKLVEDRNYTGYMFVRNRNSIVEYRNSMDNSDLYATYPIDKKSEFRVHVAFGEVVGVYRKIPIDGDSGTIRKNANCHFSRRDRARPEIGELAVKATKALELDISGVDILENQEGELYVNEVNSAPSLNNPNIDRFSQILKDYILNN